jgi:inner membrane protein
MPSPVLHTAAGLALYYLDRPASTLHRWRVASLVVLAALLPDVDFLVGLLMGQPNRFHGGFTHSLGAAVAAGAILGMLAARRRLRVGLLCLLAYASHVLLDSLTRDGRPPLGVPIFWPLTGAYFNFPLIAGIRHGLDHASVSGFLRATFSSVNLRTLLIELGIGLAMIAASLGIGRIRGRQGSLHRGRGSSAGIAEGA